MSMSLHDFCCHLPKVELHAHLNGSISARTIQRLLESRKATDPLWTPPKDWAVCIEEDGKQRSLERCFKIFKIIHELCITEEHAYMVTCDVISEFAEDNVKYLELRTTPRDITLSGMTKQSYIDAVLRGIQDTCEQKDIVVRLLLSIDRRVSIDEANLVIDMAVKLKEETNGLVVGVDFSGDPNVGELTHFISTLQKAKKNNLKISCHLAETAENVSETAQILRQFLPDRIGHGSCLHLQSGGTEELESIVKQHKIPLEICLTSNLKSGSTKKISDHHLNLWKKDGHPLVICTDDKGVFCTSLSEEYMLAAQTAQLERSDVWQMSYTAIDYIFADLAVQQKLRSVWDESKMKLLAE